MCYIKTVLFCSLDILLAYLILEGQLGSRFLRKIGFFLKIHFFPSHVNKMTHFNLLTMSKTFHLPPLKIIISDDKILANVAMTKN